MDIQQLVPVSAHHRGREGTRKEGKKKRQERGKGSREERERGKEEGRGGKKRGKKECITVLKTWELCVIQCHRYTSKQHDYKQPIALIGCMLNSKNLPVKCNCQASMSLLKSVQEVYDQSLTVVL